MSDTITVKEISDGVRRFSGWIERVGYESYDPYDIWGMPYSLWARKVYYTHPKIGTLFIAPILLADTFFPAIRKCILKKERFATADAQLILAFLNLFDTFQDTGFLHKAEKLAEDLLGYSIPGYSGYCWGYPFDWQNSGALWKRNTPYITATPYCYEAFCRLYDITKKACYLEVAQSISRFVAEDLKDTPVGEGCSAGSYSPIDSSKVINATAYRAMVLVDASQRFGVKRYREIADKNIRFILKYQQQDGAWLYEIDHAKGAFIDHFHTCFVLKNLIKINRYLKEDAIVEVIRKGFAYYRTVLFKEDGRPKPFAIEPRFQIVVEDLYNYAEAITLCSMMDEVVSGTVAYADTLAGIVLRQFQLKDGYFVTKVYRAGIKTKFPFLRWSQAQLFYGLTNLLAIKSK